VPVDDRLEQTLLRLEPALGRASHQWWIISSAAVALHMKGGVVVGDVDVLLDERDVAVVFAALDIVPATGQGTELFRSRAFGTWLGAPLAVELFAGFELCEAGRWSQIVPLSRIEITLGSARTFVPDARELAQMLLRFGRDKDRRRAALLSASCPFPSRSGIA